MGQLWENPMGTDGFEFVEYSSPEPETLGRLFEQMGFVAIARHRSKNVTLYRQGKINFILNAEPSGFPRRFAQHHGPCVCAIAFRVKDAAKAYDLALAQGAWGVETRAGAMELNIPCIKGIGDSLIYLVDRYDDRGSIYEVDFIPIKGADPYPKGAGLTYIDHLTHNVYRGRMDEWADFYQRLFNFKQIGYFDIEGKLTGLRSKAMTSPCGKIRIPINESRDDKSQIQEYLETYHGEGIQHIALGTNNIYHSVAMLREKQLPFQDTIDTYFDLIDDRIPGHGEDTERLRKERILIDGAPTQGQGLLLQIFTDTVIGPIFFEIIQRKGNEGFGEGNFQALFESIELDQIRRGIISDME